MKRIGLDVVACIKKDREELGSTLSELVSRYGVAKSTVCGIIKGCDSSRVKKSAPGRRVVGEVRFQERPSLSKTDLGEASRQTICARLMLKGIKVFRPMTEDTPIDLLVMRGDGSMLRCQCKYIFPRKSGSHVMPLFAVRKNGPGCKAVKHRYSAEEVDFFLGYCLDDDGVYVIPNSETNGVKQLAFWVMRDSYGGCGNGLDTRPFKNAFEPLR